MPNILDYYEYAKLATAAYVNLDGKPLDGTIVAIQANAQERLPSLLADQTFDSNKSGGQPVWTIPTGGYHGNDAEGFAATLFTRGSEKVLAIRGTEPFIDGGTDFLKADLEQIGGLGLAMGQAVSMINYLLRLQAGSTSQVRQFALSSAQEKPTGGPSIKLPNGNGYLYLSETASQPGLGLIGAGEKIVVTGHSLGGHLAALAARLFPNLISEAYTYNAPGYDPVTANIIGLYLDRVNPVAGAVLGAIGNMGLQLTDEFVDLAAKYLTVPPAANFSNLNIHTLESEDIDNLPDINIVPSVITGAQVFGNETIVTTERNSHLIEPIMDSLALQSLLYRMSNNLTLNGAKELLKISSNRSQESLENCKINGVRDDFQRISRFTEFL